MSAVLTFFLLFIFFSRLPSVPLRRRGCTKPPLLKAPSHCKRMSLSHRKQSAFIMSYLPGPRWQQSWYPGRANAFGPRGSRGQGLRLREIVRAQGLFGEPVLDLSIRLWRRERGGEDRRLALSLILDNVPSLSLFFFVFVRAWFADHACSFSSFRIRAVLRAHVLTSGEIIG